MWPIRFLNLFQRGCSRPWDRSLHAGPFARGHRRRWKRQHFAQVPHFGLSSPKSYQHPKQKSCSTHSIPGVGVLGYMGLFCRGHSSTVSSSLAMAVHLCPWIFHLLGISSEPEANFWAYRICINSVSPAVRFSGYFGLLPYVLSMPLHLLKKRLPATARFHPSRDFADPFVKKQAYWRARYNPWVGRCRNWCMSITSKATRFLQDRKTMPVGGRKFLPCPWRLVEINVARNLKIPSIRRGSWFSILRREKNVLFFCKTGTYWITNFFILEMKMKRYLKIPSNF